MKIEQAQMVYVILNPETKRIKIGIATDVKSRLSGLESGCGCKLEVLYNTLPLENAIYYEKRCHNHLKESRYHGEWFNVSRADAIKAVKEITADARIDEFADLYLNKHKTLADLAILYDVTRQGVAKRLLKYGIYRNRPNDTYRIKKEKKPIIQKTNGNIVINNEPEQPRINKVATQVMPEFSLNSYIRIAPNTYKHKTSEDIVKAKWIDGRMQQYIEGN